MRMKEIVYKERKFYFLNEEFSDYEMKEFPNDVDWAVVNYETGSYDGSGDMIVKKDGKFFLFSCGHCSCNGPTDGMNFNSGYAGLEEIKTSKDYEEDLKPIFDFINEKSLA